MWWWWPVGTRSATSRGDGWEKVRKYHTMVGPSVDRSKTPKAVGTAQWTVERRSVTMAGMVHRTWSWW